MSDRSGETREFIIARIRSSDGKKLRTVKRNPARAAGPGKAVRGYIIQAITPTIPSTKIT